MLAKMWRKRNTPPLLVRLEAGPSTLEINLVVPQKIGHSTTTRSSNTTPELIPRSFSPTCKKDTCSTMFIAALFIIARSWKEPRCPSTEELQPYRPATPTAAACQEAVLELSRVHL